MTGISVSGRRAGAEYLRIRPVNYASSPKCRTHNSCSKLDGWKSRYGASPAPLERLLAQAAKARILEPEDLIRLHETVLFLRAWPASAEVARLADELLCAFGDRVAAAEGGEGPSPIRARGLGDRRHVAHRGFGCDVARSLAARYPRNVDIAWDAVDQPDRLGPVLCRLLPMMAEDWPVEAHAPFRDWVRGAHCADVTDLGWLLSALDGLEAAGRARADLYDSLGLPLTWQIGDLAASRSRMRLAGSEFSCQVEPLLRRRDVNINQELNSQPLPARRLFTPKPAPSWT